MCVTYRCHRSVTLLCVMKTWPVSLICDTYSVTTHNLPNVVTLERVFIQSAVGAADVWHLIALHLVVMKAYGPQKWACVGPVFARRPFGV